MKTEQQIADELAPSALQALCPAGVLISRVSLKFTLEATEETLRRVDGLLAEVGETHQYLVGDYINHLFRTQGEEVARAYVEAGNDPETRRNAAWVCKNVAIERRLIAPSFTHAKTVAALDPTEQEIWLSKAREDGLSSRQLRTELRKRSAITKGAPSQAPADQGASKASAAFEVWRVWFEANASGFTPEQSAEWNGALLAVMTERARQMDEATWQQICDARAAAQRD